MLTEVSWLFVKVQKDPCFDIRFKKKNVHCSLVFFVCKKKGRPQPQEATGVSCGVVSAGETGTPLQRHTLCGYSPVHRIHCHSMEP